MLTPTKIAVLVSGGGTNLQALIDAEARSEITSGKITLVVSNRPDAYALTRAANAGIPTVVINKTACTDARDFECQLVDALESAGIELIVLAGFLSILSEDFTKRYARRIINIHPSLIPAFCGAGFYGLHVHEAALARGVKLTGATVHYVNEIPDGGEIILQQAVEVQPGDTPEVLQRRVMEEAEWHLLPRATELVSHRIANER